MRRLPRVDVCALAIALSLASGCGGEIGDDDGSSDDGGNGDGDGDGVDGGGSGPDGADHAAGEPLALAGITAAHNAVRAGVGVGPMTWNAELAATAQAWADACVDSSIPIGLIDHNDGRSDGHPYYVGENIYGSGGGATGPDAVETWTEEVVNYDYASNTCSCGPECSCGHYTQVVWATSVDLGCGISNCAGLAYGNAIVCDYGPGGNVGGARPY